MRPGPPPELMPLLAPELLPAPDSFPKPVSKHVPWHDVVPSEPPSTLDAVSLEVEHASSIANRPNVPAKRCFAWVLFRNCSRTFEAPMMSPDSRFSHQ
jgi:hypothetical protein